MEQAGRAERAVMDAADATNWRREKPLLLGMFVFLFSKCGSRFCDLRFHPVVGPVLRFSTLGGDKFSVSMNRHLRIDFSGRANQFTEPHWRIVAAMHLRVPQCWS